MNKFFKYFYNIFVSIDQLANTLLAGDPDETISSRIGKALKEGSTNKILINISNLLSRIQPDHCKYSIEEDEGGDQIWNWAKKKKRGKRG